MNGDLHDEERDMWGEPPEEDAMIDRASLIGAAEGIALRDGTHNLRYIVGALYDEHIARASRPREAGSGEDGLAQAAAACQSIALRYEAQAGEWNANAKAYAARECARAIHALRRGATHAQSHPSPGGGNAQVGGATERAAGIVPQAGSNVAPEACPVAWAVVDASGEFWDAAPLLSKDYADKRVATLNRKYGQIVNTPYRVVPLYAQPASATAERGGEAKAANTNAVARAVGGLLDAWDLSDEDSVVEKVRPHMKAIHRLIERDEFYATPASAAGREGVARFIEECDERHNHRCACYAMSMENRRCDEAKSIAAIRALLAAEAEGGWES